MEQFVIALGMFDGVHLGHRALLCRAAELAHSNGDTAVAFTYTNHPRELFCGSFEYVSTADRRAALCRTCGIDRVDAVPFTRTFAGQTPEAFLQGLSERYGGKIAAIVCGYDFRFGAGAEGDGTLLSALGTEYGFSTEILPPVLYEGEPCSSTRVRLALRNGAIPLANAMLGRPFLIEGRVIHNKALGRTFGYPTANVDYGRQILPADGVYATALHADSALYASVTNVGSNPTVGGSARTVETHVPDQSLDLYGKRIGVLFFERLRGEIRFPSTDALTQQIASDAETAKKVFKEAEKSVYNLQGLW